MLDGIPVEILTPGALLGLFVLLVFTGRITTRASLTDKNQEIERWRQAYEFEREAHAAADAQVGELLDVAKTSQAVIQALHTTSERIRQSGDPDVVSKP